MSDVNKQLLEAAKLVLQQSENNLAAVNLHILEKLTKAIAAAEQAQQITDNTRVAWTSLGTVKAMLPELLASDDVKVRENAQIIDALVKLVGNQQAQPAEPEQADPAVAAIQFALETHSDGLHFLRLWNEGEFDLLRQEWPEAPEDIYIGADPLLEAPAQPPAKLPAEAVAVPDERAAFEAWLQENIDDTDTVRPSKEKVDAYFAVWLARAMLAAAAPQAAVPDEVANDAARYRWLRSIDSRANENVLVRIATKARNGWSFTTSTCEDLDVAIDKEISALDSQHAQIAAAQKGGA